jgi:predicted acetyltransferase
MAIRIRTVRNPEELAAAMGAIGHYFGWVPNTEQAEGFTSYLPLDRMHAAFDDGQVVGGAGVYPFELTVPGGPIRCAGVTIVGVQPTHRRRGLLRRMMTAQLADVREREEPIAALWASEDTIYGRYGYGQASRCVEIRLPRVWAELRPDLPPRGRTGAVGRPRRGPARVPAYLRSHSATLSRLRPSDARLVGEP